MPATAGFGPEVSRSILARRVDAVVEESILVASFSNDWFKCQT
jgi:hypothetical protein